MRQVPNHFMPIGAAAARRQAMTMMAAAILIAGIFSLILSPGTAGRETSVATSQSRPVSSPVDSATIQRDCSRDGLHTSTVTH